MSVGFRLGQPCRAGRNIVAPAGDFLSWLFENRAVKIYVSASLRELTGKFDGIVEVVHQYSRGQADEIDAALTAASGVIAESGANHPHRRFHAGPSCRTGALDAHCRGE